MDSSLRSDHEVWLAVQDRFDVGGGYYTPAAECVEVGRQLHSDDMERLLNVVPEIVVTQSSPATHHVATLWRILARLTVGDEVIFGVYDVGHLIAVNVFDEERLMQFELQVAEWRAERLGFRALTYDQASAGLVRDA